MPLPFEFALSGPPTSQQTRRRVRVRQWTENVRNTARVHWDGSSPVAGAVAVDIVYVFDSIPIDVDNIPKPILDALKGLVYSDDSQVTDLICRMRRWDSALRTTTLSQAFEEFLRHHSTFIYVRISAAPSPGDPL